MHEGVYDKTLLETKVTTAAWDPAASVWRVSTDRGDEIAAKFLVCGCGPLSTPRLPDIDGMAKFKGESMHTSQWNDDIDLEGKTVAVVDIYLERRGTDNVLSVLR